MFQYIKDLFAAIKHRDELWLAMGLVVSLKKAIKSNKNPKKGMKYLYGNIGKKAVELVDYYDMYSKDC